MLDLFENHKVISIVGMAKNVGKTTTLNYLLKKMYQKKKVGLTSLGRDGELNDIVFNHPKPRIYVECGTIIATTTMCLKQSDITKQILYTTGINTALGEVLIVRALSDGYVNISGPSFNVEMKKVVDMLQLYGADLILVDGAINRLSIARDDISDGTVLCTGASYSGDIEKVVNDTLHIANLFTLPEISDELKEQFSTILNKSPISVVNRKVDVRYFNIDTTLNNSKEIIGQLTKSDQYLLINGVITDNLLNTILLNHKQIKDLTLITTHPTKCLFQKETYEKINKINVRINTIKSTELLFISANPFSPYGYTFEEADFINALKSKTNIPVINVMRDSYE